ncbi:ATP phosphoribosyltransferase regulatory subunit [Virgibacillus natechei]|uniref:ATP phosphoribosyltransferase regulatory subunit n=1 Tax=Virgibacillus natechei TaxID=1216297 RepID=A0ABS4IC83_9BACI|nr:ATP phosphoribosyltransferase regulatory subunit [Virgibacillus natechei]MBP1968542.1 ATP phosphoribosyltransferase regulatory subunit [Virgibacillus natechei]UZD13657.1 ATP phosphoribosyltransferase regulatory subunit [Virgibacillus natechei]
MQPYIIDNSQDTSVEDFQVRDNLVRTLKNRFTTYGYKQIQTSTFESYDLYSSISGTVNKDEMIKVVDTSGKVMVLRPDVTIPISRMTALNKQSRSTNNTRVFYVMDVFRQAFEQEDQKEKTQAGIEYFGENTPQSNAEVLMLAIHTLKDLGFSNFKIEIGHAGLFKELVKQALIQPEELDVLLSLIQSKNTAEIEPFLKNLAIDTDLQEAIQAIPLMYGDPLNVIQQAKKIIRNEEMQAILQNLIDVYDVLKDFQAEDSVVFNLGLINNMNYYSGIIFQGFVDNIGKPILMGGRYDNLSDQYNEQIPAIGFAFEIELLLHALSQQGLAQRKQPSVDMVIYYELTRQKDALYAAYRLREAGYQIVTFPTSTIHPEDTRSLFTVRYEAKQQVVYQNQEVPFVDVEELIDLLQEERLLS